MEKIFEKIFSAIPDMPTCFTGGAEGADYHFTGTALAWQHLVRVASFHGHKNTLPPSPFEGQLVIDNLTSAQLDTATESLKVANEKMQRSIPKSGYVLKLLQRNKSQIDTVDSVYAIGFMDIGKGRRDSVRIQGGTAWACQMFCDKLIDGTKKEIPLYFFCQTSNAWYQCELKGSEVIWDRMVNGTFPPRPTGNYAGIGTRELNLNGRIAINQLYECEE